MATTSSVTVTPVVSGSEGHAELSQMITNDNKDQKVTSEPVPEPETPTAFSTPSGGGEVIPDITWHVQVPNKVTVIPHMIKFRYARDAYYLIKYGDDALKFTLQQGGSGSATEASEAQKAFYNSAASCIRAILSYYPRGLLFNTELKKVRDRTLEVPEECLWLVDEQDGAPEWYKTKFAAIVRNLASENKAMFQRRVYIRDPYNDMVIDHDAWLRDKFVFHSRLLFAIADQIYVEGAVVAAPTNLTAQVDWTFIQPMTPNYRRILDYFVEARPTHWSLMNRMITDRINGLELRSDSATFTYREMLLNLGANITQLSRATNTAALLTQSITLNDASASFIQMMTVKALSRWYAFGLNIDLSKPISPLVQIDVLLQTVINKQVEYNDDALRQICNVIYITFIYPVMASQADPNHKQIRAAMWSANDVDWTVNSQQNNLLLMALENIDARDKLIAFYGQKVFNGFEVTGGGYGFAGDGQAQNYQTTWSYQSRMQKFDLLNVLPGELTQAYSPNFGPGGAAYFQDAGQLRVNLNVTDNGAPFLHESADNQPVLQRDADTIPSRVAWLAELVSVLKENRLFRFMQMGTLSITGQQMGALLEALVQDLPNFQTTMSSMNVFHYNLALSGMHFEASDRDIKKSVFVDGQTRRPYLYYQAPQSEGKSMEASYMVGEFQLFHDPVPEQFLKNFRHGPVTRSTVMLNLPAVTAVVFGLNWKKVVPTTNNFSHMMAGFQLYNDVETLLEKIEANLTLFPRKVLPFSEAIQQALSTTDGPIKQIFSKILTDRPSKMIWLPASTHGRLRKEIIDVARTLHMNSWLHKATHSAYRLFECEALDDLPPHYQAAYFRAGTVDMTGVAEINWPTFYNHVINKTLRTLPVRQKLSAFLPVEVTDTNFDPNREVIDSTPNTFDVSVKPVQIFRALNRNPYALPDIDQRQVKAPTWTVRIDQMPERFVSSSILESVGWADTDDELFELATVDVFYNKAGTGFVTVDSPPADVSSSPGNYIAIRFRSMGEARFVTVRTVPSVQN